MIRIAPEALSDEALIGVLDDFILREGTEYGEREYSLESKRADLRGLLERGLAQIWFDPDTQTVTLRTTDEPGPPAPDDGVD